MFQIGLHATIDKELLLPSINISYHKQCFRCEFQSVHKNGDGNIIPIKSTQIHQKYSILWVHKN